MWKDPIVEEVRSHREAHAAKFDFDLAAICRDLRRQQDNSGRKIVSLPARRVKVVDSPGKDQKQVGRYTDS